MPRVLTHIGTLSISYYNILVCNIVCKSIRAISAGVLHKQQGAGQPRALALLIWVAAQAHSREHGPEVRLLNQVDEPLFLLRFGSLHLDPQLLDVG